MKTYKELENIFSETQREVSATLGDLILQLSNANSQLKAFAQIIENLEKENAVMRATLESLDNKKNKEDTNGEQGK